MHTIDPERGRQPGEHIDDPGTLVPMVAKRGRYRALASLLGDDSPVVRDEVRRQYERAGREGLPSLVRATTDPSPIVRGRARTLLLDREKTLVIRRLLRHIAGKKIELEKALFLLARYSDPRLDPRPWQAQLDTLSREVWKRTRGVEDPLDRAQIMVEYLATEMRFSSAKGDFHHPDNVHIHRVLERRRGMPLALCAIYMFVGKRAGISTACVPLPGLVMLRLHGNGTSRIVDPYNKGLVRTDRECREYLKQHGLPVKSAWFKDADDALLLKRQIANLVRSADLRNLPRERRELSLVARALDLRRAVAAPNGA
ncbi:MAG: transglutaminase-like domain-containing protein [Planctomycetota bacterium]|nr:transglutaminase-like domain-containing protein [Planctomycetota bacterium]